MKMVEWYGAIEKLLERVDFGAIYPGFHRYPFALYTSREICLKGDVIYCGRFVCLNENGSERSFLSAVALKLAPGAENRVIGYFQ